MSQPPDRRDLRLELRQRRRALSPAHRIAAAESLAARLLALPSFPREGHVAGYWATDGEVGLHAWQLALPPSLTYCLPVLHEDGRLRFAPWSPGSPLLTNRHGIPEPDVAAHQLLMPESLQLVVVPLVGFDERCHRLGMGGGWYDRSFAFRQDSPASPSLVGAAFAAQRVDQVDDAPWDVRLDAVCCEDATYLAGAIA